jgi:hypothetical protein
MKGRTKNQLLAVLVVAIIAVVALFFLTYPRQVFFTLDSLVGIAYVPAVPDTSCAPPCAPPQACSGGACAVPPPALTYQFANALDASSLAGTTATLLSFTPDAGAPAGAADFVTALLTGGGVPFAPVLAGGNTAVTSNSVPAAVARYPGPISVTGRGVVKFSYPLRAKKAHT